MARRGFTLVELAVVVAVLAVVAAIAMPRFASASARSKLDAAASRVVNDIALSAASAQAASASRQIIFDAPTDQYILFGVRSQGGYANRTVRLGDAPYETDIVSASFDGSLFLSMNGYGTTEYSGTINLALGLYGKRIVLLAGANSVQVNTLELVDVATGNVMPAVRQVTSQVTVDASRPSAARRLLD